MSVQTKQESAEGGQQQKRADRYGRFFQSSVPAGLWFPVPLGGDGISADQNDGQLCAAGNSLYRDNWVVQNVVGIIPDDMTKKWYTLSGGIGPAQLAEFQRLQRVTPLRERVKKDCVGAGSTAARRG